MLEPVSMFRSVGLCLVASVATLFAVAACSSSPPPPFTSDDEVVGSKKKRTPASEDDEAPTTSDGILTGEPQAPPDQGASDPASGGSTTSSGSTSSTSSGSTSSGGSSTSSGGSSGGGSTSSTSSGGSGCSDPCTAAQQGLYDCASGTQQKRCNNRCWEVATCATGTACYSGCGGCRPLSCNCAPGGCTLGDRECTGVYVGPSIHQYRLCERTSAGCTRWVTYTAGGSACPY